MTRPPARAGGRRRRGGRGWSRLQLHRLGLPARLLPPAEADLVGALSGPVGFDPEPGVHGLAPAFRTGDPARSAMDRAVRRIARVSGLPLLRYRCLELAVVVDEAGPDEAGPDDRAG